MKKLLITIGILLTFCGLSAAQSNANIGGVNFGSGASTPPVCNAPSYFYNTSAKTYSVCVNAAYVGLGTSGGSTVNPSFTGVTLGPDGSQTAPSYSFTSTPGAGFWLDASAQPTISKGGVARFNVETLAVSIPTGNIYCWATSTVGTACDTGVSKGAAAIIDFGNGAAASTVARLKASAYMSLGTKFATNAGCTEGTLVGGGSAGKFTIGTGGSCTVIVTMGDTATAPNGWACQVSDMTTSIDAYNVHESASNATTATFVVGVAVSSDVIQFSCIGY